MSTLSDLRARFRWESVTLKLDDIQALILRSRPEPYVGVHALLRVDDAQGGRDLIGRLEPHIRSAQDWTEDLDAWVGVAITHEGLAALGVPESSLQTFPLAFQQGMAARADQLRDVGENAPKHWEPAFRSDDAHIAVTIYAKDEAALKAAMDTAMTEVEHAKGITIVATHTFGADESAENPFGFRDSISQPTVAGAGVEPLPGDERAIAAGEFILGEKSETGQPLSIPQPDILGRNGTYVVLRKYGSRPGAFNDFIRSHATTEAERDLLAAKMFGRWRSGAPLPLSPDHDDPELGADRKRNNDFTYSDDVAGTVCPHASHMRRMNPRDSELTILTDVNIHRIIRRSSTYGPKWTPQLTKSDDKTNRSGLYFIFISARAYDTIEFLQQEWINRGNFIDLGEERDPIVGLHEQPGSFTIPGETVRERVDGVTTFNRLLGGAYMFMPSKSALQWISYAGWQ